jgi:hypothetical protein
MWRQNVHPLHAYFGGTTVDNRAVLCGPESGIFVLDIDPRHNGNHGLHLLLTQHSDLPPAPTVRTADGGAHFYFRYPGVPGATAGKCTVVLLAQNISLWPG